MNKLFVSTPMRGREIEDIRARMNYILSAVNKLVPSESEKYELLDTIWQEPEPDDIRHHCYYLGKSISALSQADLVVFDVDWYEATGCRFEKWVCDNYDIPYLLGMDKVVDTSAIDKVVGNFIDPTLKITFE